jgi:hypothetical protein
MTRDISSNNADSASNARMAGAGGDDNADAGYVTVGGYSAAEAASAIQLFLEGGISLQGFTEWLDGYPFTPNTSEPDRVEDQINRATLAVRGYQRGTRDEEALRQELMDVRGRLSGLGFSAGQQTHTGATRDPSGRSVDRSFP